MRTAVVLALLALFQVDFTRENPSNGVMMHAEKDLSKGDARMAPPVRQLRTGEWPSMLAGDWLILVYALQKSS